MYYEEKELARITERQTTLAGAMLVLTGMILTHYTPSGGKGLIDYGLGLLGAPSGIRTDPEALQLAFDHIKAAFPLPNASKRADAL